MSNTSWQWKHALFLLQFYFKNVKKKNCFFCYLLPDCNFIRNINYQYQTYQAYLEKLKQSMQKVNYILISRKYACNCMATGPWLVIHLSINFMCTFDNWKWKKNSEVLLIRGSIDLFLTQKREWSRYASFAFREITVTDIYGEDLFSLTLSCIAATQFKRLSAY